jgi:hypothetical protein
MSSKYSMCALGSREQDRHRQLNLGVGNMLTLGIHLASVKFAPLWVCVILKTSRIVAMSGKVSTRMVVRSDRRSRGEPDQC